MNLSKWLRGAMVSMPLAFAAMSVAGCQPNKPPAAAQPQLPMQAKTQMETKTQEVSIDNFTFTPSTLTIRAGTTVTWTNHDDVPHTVTADDKKFRSEALEIALLNDENLVPAHAANLLFGRARLLPSWRLGDFAPGFQGDHA